MALETLIKASYVLSLAISFSKESPHDLTSVAEMLLEENKENGGDGKANMLVKVNAGAAAAI